MMKCLFQLNRIQNHQRIIRFYQRIICFSKSKTQKSILYILIASLALLLSLGMHQPVLIATQPPAQNQEMVLMQTGKQYYDTGQFLAAKQEWQQAQQSYGAVGDTLNEALAYSFISLATQQLGEWQEAQAAIDTSLSLLAKEGKPSPKEVNRVRAQVLNTQGRLQLIRGKSSQDAAEAALKTWQESESVYRQAGDAEGVLGSQINQAQAMRSLGLYHQAKKLFTNIKQTLENQPDSRLKVTGLRTLGDLLRQSGKLQQSENILTQALGVAKASGLNQEQAAILLSLGNTARARKNTDAAMKAYQAAATIAAKFPQLKIQAQLNQLGLHLEKKQWSQAESLWKPIRDSLYSLPSGRPAVVAKINLAKNLICLQLRNQAPICPEKAEIPQQLSSDSGSITQEVIQLLNTAAQQAKTLQDKQIQSYALGNLGQFYEQTGDWQNASNYTEQALNLAQQIQALEIAYQWQWQLGRLLKERDKTGAIAAYSQAVNSLQTLRGDLVTLNPDIQFDFREEVEPVYRQLVDLLLEPEKPPQKNLQQARTVIEGLQLAELNNFFQDACLKTRPEQLDTIIDTAATPTAAIYAIALPERLEVILKLPKNPNLLHYRTRVSQGEVETTLNQMREELTQPKPSVKFPKLSQQAYDWLLRQAEPKLTKSQVQTLVFILDFPLQNIPIAALDDGNKYLIEKYALTLSPGLQLLEPEPVTEEKLNILLLGGVSEARKLEARTFAALNNVSQEIAQIQSQIPSTQKLFNTTFTKANLENKIESVPFSVIHVATHGNFSSNAENTFILLWDNLLKAKDFDEILQKRDPSQANAIELLTLSACETAAGDKRATLGLAGIAVRSRARSTLATLWRVDDTSTANLMVKFYQELKDNPQLSKAEALRRAQIYLLQEEPNTNYKLPYYWAPFVLVGNWL
ncbi:MAG: CHAT domain-containing protein [Nostocaceae cyanobacterium]|nr:CHAT domain-containing protein [Nostocaceae cyanobacterium]